MTLIRSAGIGALALGALTVAIAAPAWSQGILP